VGLLQDMGWSIDIIGWDKTSGAAGERRISFVAHNSGNGVHSICPESGLPTRPTGSFKIRAWLKLKTEPLPQAGGATQFPFVVVTSLPGSVA
jgi:hypothetical protein